MKNRGMVEKMMKRKKKTGDIVSAVKRERDELRTKVEQVISERDMAIAAIPHTCFYCSRGFQTEEGFDCNECHYRGKESVCLNWRWRGWDRIWEERLRKKEKEVYFLVIQEKYVRDMQIFAPEGQWSRLQEEDIFLSSELEHEWKDWNGCVFLCQIVAGNNELKEKIKETAGRYKIPEEILEIIPVKEIQEDTNTGIADTVLGRKSDREELVRELGEEGYIEQFYAFLQGKFHPDNIQMKDVPTLSPDQAWHVIYCMQEYFGLFDDNFERCKDCGCIYDSQNGGTVISEETEPLISQDEYGTYCEDCRPD